MREVQIGQDGRVAGARKRRKHERDVLGDEEWKTQERSSEREMLRKVDNAVEKHNDLCREATG